MNRLVRNRTTRAAGQNREREEVSPGTQTVLHASPPGKPLPKRKLQPATEETPTADPSLEHRRRQRPGELRLCQLRVLQPTPPRSPAGPHLSLPAGECPPNIQTCGRSSLTAPLCQPQPEARPSTPPRPPAPSSNPPVLVVPGKSAGHSGPQ
jgi:hypothetical protein